MPAPLSATDNGLLLDLWQVSLALAVAGVSIALILVARRWYEDIRDHRNAVRRKQFDAFLWAVLDTQPVPEKTAFPPLKKGDAAIICDLALDLLRPSRGEEAARIVQCLQNWNIQPEIAKMLARGRRGQRIRMLTLLAHFDDPKSLDLLKRWIANEDIYVQLGALRSLALRNALSALPDILSQLAKRKRHNIPMLADVLERFGPQAASVLLPLACNQGQGDVRFAAISALGALGSLEAVPDLAALVLDPNPDIRAQAVAALSRIGDARAEPAIATALTDRSSAVRLQAAQAAGVFQMHGAASTLIKMLSDEFWWVRYRAAEALYRIGGAGPVLLRSASMTKDVSGEIAAQVLAEMESA